MGYSGFKRASVGIKRFGASASGEEVLQRSGVKPGSVANAGGPREGNVSERGSGYAGRLGWRAGRWALPRVSGPFIEGREVGGVEREEVGEGFRRMTEIQRQRRLNLSGGFVRAGLCGAFATVGNAVKPSGYSRSWLGR